MITSMTNGRIKWVVSLMEKARMRRKEQKYVVEGIRMFLEVPEELLCEAYISADLERRAQNKGTPEAEVLRKLQGTSYDVVSDDVFRKLSDTVNPQGILAVVAFHETPVEKMFSGKENPLFLMLENLQDPGNLGTILRTAEGAGVDGIFLSRDCVDVYNPKVIRSTMGAIYRVPFICVEDLKETIQELQKREICVYAAALNKEAVSYDAYDYTAGAALLIGNEGNGLLEETVAAADKTCYIPMEGQVESLNASVAAAILMYEAYGQKRRNMK